MACIGWPMARSRLPIGRGSTTTSRGWQLPISAYNRPEQMAYWINLYNALVVRLVVDHYPIASIRDIGTPTEAGAPGPWRQELVEVEEPDLAARHRASHPAPDLARSADPLRPSCGAVSCPNLQPEPFYADQLERQLNEAAMATSTTGAASGSRATSSACRACFAGTGTTSADRPRRDQSPDGLRRARPCDEAARFDQITTTASTGGSTTRPPSAPPEPLAVAGWQRCD